LQRYVAIGQSCLLAIVADDSIAGRPFRPSPKKRWYVLQ